MAYTTIDNGEEHFSAVTYTGTGSSRSITGLEFGPDWVWIKRRNGAYSHYLYDSTRGTGKQLYAEKTDAEATDNTEVTAFNSDGFSLGSGSGTNENTNTQVAWCWKANGGTTSSNSNGSITSTVQANTTAGFSIVTYAGSNSASTVGHGLGAVPEVIFVKNRDASANWKSYHKPISETPTLSLNGTGAKSDQESFNDTAPTSTVFSLLGNTDNVNRSGENFVAYCFTPIKGYSKFGKYKGNATSGDDGTFVYTGFKPAWIMVKSDSNSGQEWVIFDNKRDTFNEMDAWLYANATTAEDSGGDEREVDFVSNGFKFRNAGGPTSYSGRDYIYLAFAEHPFVSSEGVPVTAR